MHREFDPAKLSEREQYKLMTGTIVPRPIALVTTIGEHGPNAAPFSLFNIVGTEPPMLYFAVGNQDDGSEKDTIQNLRRNPEFVVHIVDCKMAAQMNVCSTNFPADVDEMVEAGFTVLPSKVVRPPRIAESPVHFEGRIMQIIDIGARHHIVLGEVVWIHCREDLLDERLRVNFERLDPVARLSGSLYGRITDTFSLERAYL